MKKIGFILLMGGYLTTFCSDKTVIINQPHPAEIVAAVAVSHANSRAAHKATRKGRNVTRKVAGKQGRRLGRHLRKMKF